MPLGPKIGITGAQGAGKTTTIKKVIEILVGEGLIVGGMITETIVDKNGIKELIIVDLLSGNRETFASRDVDSEFEYEGLGVDISVLEGLGIEAIESGIEKGDVIVIDEVGKVELESEAFKGAVGRALKSNKKMLLTLHKKSRAVMLQEIRRRDDIRILEVTMINRSILPFRIVSYLHEEHW